MTQAMLESPAWAAMTLAARKVVDRIAIEHLGHGLGFNGELTVTYDDFERFGLRRSSVLEAIAVANGLGFIDVTVRGARSYGVRKVPSQYGLTWLPRRDGTPASNRWKGIDQGMADAAVRRARERAWRPRQTKRGRPPIARDIDSSSTSVTGDDPQKSAKSSLKIVTG
jgi:hypothetical protein